MTWLRDDRLLRVSNYCESIWSMLPPNARMLGSGISDVPLNPFELSVKRGLDSRGIPYTPQYGVCGYRIDFACAHPDEPGRMVLAVEADGASYHSIPTTRDRDRLRQQVLESKGWRFHRIWSTAWFRDRQAELDKVELPAGGRKPSRRRTKMSCRRLSQNGLSLRRAIRCRNAGCDLEFLGRERVATTTSQIMLTGNWWNLLAGSVPTLSYERTTT